MGLPIPRGMMPRAGAVQRVDQSPTSAVIRTQYRSADILDRRWFSRYQEWQDWSRKYAKILGVVRFAAGITADTCARCDIQIEERDTNGDWDATDNKQLLNIFDAYCNDRQMLEEMIRTHAWHYQIAGEMFQVVRDDPDAGGVAWSLHSTRAAEFDKPSRGFVRIKEAPNGNERDGTAFVVPRDQCVRFWLPDEEWPALATSPMAASIEDLHRYHAINRYQRKAVESRIAMNGVLWTPGEAHQAAQMGREGPGAGSDQPGSQIDRDYVDWAKRAFTDDEDVAGVAAFGLHWDSKFGHPVWVKIGEPLDPHLIEASNDALTAYARGINLPTSLVVGGGPGKANHWTEWLVDDKFFEFGIAWVMDRITHLDLTKTFLRAYLRLLRLPQDRFRVGYDKNPVIVKPDRSDQALKFYLAGLLGGVPTLEAGGWDPDDMMGADELAKVLDLASRGRTEWGGPDGQREPGLPVAIGGQGDTGAKPGGGGSFGDGTAGNPGTQEPGGSGGPAPGSTGPPSNQAAAGTPTHPSITKANRALRQLTQIKRDTGRQLLGAANLAFAEAMRHAGVKVKVRAARKNAETRLAAVTAVDTGAPLGPVLAAVGLKESEALQNAFVSYRSHAGALLDQAQQRRAQALIDAGYDPADYLPDEASNRPAQALGALSGMLMALAYARLTSDHPHVTPPGEVTGNVPASFVTTALHVLEGSSNATLGSTDDAMPNVVDVADYTSVEQQLADSLATDGVDTTTSYVWRWGFYGDPHKPLEVHQDLGYSDFETTMPGGDLTDDVDPDLSNPAEFPEVDYLSPGDHDGCTCEWEPVIEGMPGSEATIGRVGDETPSAVGGELVPA